MTGRERIIAALARRPADRVPVDFCGTDCSSVMGIAYARLREHLGLEKRPPRVFDIMQQIVLVDEDAADAFGSDAALLAFEPREWREWTLPDGTPALIPAALRIEKRADGSEVVLDDGGRATLRRAPEGLYFDPCFYPLASCGRPSDLHPYRDLIGRYDLPSCLDEPLDAFVERARKLHEESDRAVVLHLWLHLMQAAQILMGFEKFFCDLLLNQSLVREFLDVLAGAYEDRLRRLLPLAGPHIDVAFVTEDLGTQEAPQISPAVYREVIRPYHARIWSLVKELTGKPLLVHSCGAVREFIPDMIEMGVDALNPVQVSAAGMEPDGLVRDFGDSISFWGGGCDTQKVLSRGTPEEVREEVQRRLEQFRGSGHVFTQVHNIQADVPPENIVAMFEEARRQG